MGLFAWADGLFLVEKKLKIVGNGSVQDKKQHNSGELLFLFPKMDSSYEVLYFDIFKFCADNWEIVQITWEKVGKTIPVLCIEKLRKRWENQGKQSFSTEIILVLI